MFCTKLLSACEIILGRGGTVGTGLSSLIIITAETLVTERTNAALMQTIESIDFEIFIRE
ncbi:MAG: hypothetical protein WCL70_13370 [Paludibacter sp.]